MEYFIPLLAYFVLLSFNQYRAWCDLERILMGSNPLSTHTLEGKT
ncbi:hypothetical protein LCGC14_2962830 [marine sediment metagenome]|uniref:Uncharacterized protein n=1 Tax=marine sediment metagenome TaxID=412755 RepID=A0A0F8XZ43_9ZZZZ